MTDLRQSAMRELDKLPEDKLTFIIQIMQEVNGLYNEGKFDRKVSKAEENQKKYLFNNR